MPYACDWSQENFVVQFPYYPAFYTVWLHCQSPSPNACTGVKKSLVLVPGTSWISGRTSIYFHPMSCGQVKNSLIVYFSLTRTSYLVTGPVKILMYLPGGQVKIFRFFLPLLYDKQGGSLFYFYEGHWYDPDGVWTHDFPMRGVHSYLLSYPVPLYLLTEIHN